MKNVPPRRVPSSMARRLPSHDDTGPPASGEPSQFTGRACAPTAPDRTSSSELRVSGGGGVRRPSLRLVPASNEPTEPTDRQVLQWAHGFANYYWGTRPQVADDVAGELILWWYAKGRQRWRDGGIRSSKAYFRVAARRIGISLLRKLTRFDESGRLFGVRPGGEQGEAAIPDRPTPAPTDVDPGELWEARDAALSAFGELPPMDATVLEVERELEREGIRHADPNAEGAARVNARLDPRRPLTATTYRQRVSKAYARWEELAGKHSELIDGLVLQRHVNQQANSAARAFEELAPDSKLALLRVGRAVLGGHGLDSVDPSWRDLARSAMQELETNEASRQRGWTQFLDRRAVILEILRRENKG